MHMCHASAHAGVGECTCTCEHEFGEVVNVPECKGCSCHVREGGKERGWVVSVCKYNILLRVGVQAM